MNALMRARPGDKSPNRAHKAWPAHWVYGQRWYNDACQLIYLMGPVMHWWFQPPLPD